MKFGFIQKPVRPPTKNEWALLFHARKIEPGLTLTELRRRMREQKRQQRL
jgi:hypothetical protein